MVADVYGRTLLIQNYARELGIDDPIWSTLFSIARQKFPILDSGLLKQRRDKDDAAIQGYMIAGDTLEKRVLENGVRYALNLQLNQDAGFFLDTRVVRRYLAENSHDLSVLNTFAYTGSLGVAARAGGAKRVAHIDLKRHFLNVAKDSYTLNGFPIRKKDFVRNDFFREASRLRRAEIQFDTVVLDPPFFSSTTSGTVDLNHEATSIINKTRPLVKNGGRLLVINNALYLPGADFYQAIQVLEQEGFVEIEKLLDVDQDSIGFPDTVINALPTNPSPFNHSTKIVILKLTHKT